MPTFKIDHHDLLIVGTTLTMTGRELLGVANKTPVEQYKLYQVKTDGAQLPIELDQVVDMSDPQLGRFVTINRSQISGG